MNKKTLIPLSGGIDSTVLLARAISNGDECFTISFDYGQRHRLELKAADKIARYYKVPHQTIRLDPSCFGYSTVLINKNPKNAETSFSNTLIPNTYVPARNTLFLSYLLGFAETLNIDEIHFGANKDDRPYYPDCRPEFFSAFEKVMHLGTQMGIEKRKPVLKTPLIDLNKKEIVTLALEYSAPLSLTLSCYDPTPLSKHCGNCLSCQLRKKAFEDLKNEAKDQHLDLLGSLSSL
ncbi:MAG: 7-cyano-7-deazaguanine synthase QueC [Chlamydiales bacterium]